MRTNAAREAFTLGPLLVVVLVTGGFLLGAQATLAQLGLTTLVFLLFEALPGVVVWRLVRPASGWLVEDLAMGGAIGLGLGVLAQVVALAAGLPALAWIVPWLPVLVALSLRAGRARVLSGTWEGLPRGWGIGLAMVTAASLWSALRFVGVLPVRWSGWAIPYVDMPFHLALAGELKDSWPPHYPQVAGEPLAYHWFSHAWVAHLGSLSGVSLDVVQDRFMPALLAVLVPALVACVAVRLTGAAWTGVLAAVFLVLVAAVNLWPLDYAAKATYPLSPSTGFGNACMLAALNVMILRWRLVLRSPASAVLLAGLFVVAGGSKGTILPVVFAGGLTALAASVLLRAARNRVRTRTILLDVASCLTVLVIEFGVVFDGQGGGLTLTPLTSLARRYARDFGTAYADLSLVSVGLLVLVVLLVQLLPMLAFLGTLTEPGVRTDPALWLLVGAAVAGYGATIVLYRAGGSQGYFQFAGWVPLSLASAWGLWLLLPALRSLGRSLWTGLAALGAAALVAEIVLGAVPSRPAHGVLIATVYLTVIVLAVGALVWAVRERPATALAVTVVALLVVTAARTIGPNGFPRHLVESPVRAEATTLGAVHRDHVDAARWLRDHSDPDDIVMTNRHCRGVEQPGCLRTRFVVAAWSEREVLVEGWAYTARTNARAAESARNVSVGFWDPALLRLNDQFFTRPSAAAAKALYGRGVRWVYRYRAQPHGDLGRFATEVYRNHRVEIYRLDRPG